MTLTFRLLVAATVFASSTYCLCGPFTFRGHPPRQIRAAQSKVVMLYSKNDEMAGSGFIGGMFGGVVGALGGPVAVALGLTLGSVAGGLSGSVSYDIKDMTETLKDKLRDSERAIRIIAFLLGFLVFANVVCLTTLITSTFSTIQFGALLFANVVCLTMLIKYLNEFSEVLRDGMKML